MSDNFDLTSANAVVILSVDELYPNGVQIQGFSTDSSFTVDDATIAEARMGVDGKLSAGYTPAPRTVTITLEANSPSLPILSNIVEASQVTRKPFKCQMYITIPALGKEYTLANGVLQTGHTIPDGKKVLDPTAWTFIFESCKSTSI